MVKKLSLLTFILIFIVSCHNEKSIKIIAKNSINILRPAETIEVSIANAYEYQVMNSDGEIIPSQVIHEDGETDLLIFQTDFEFLESKEFKLVKIEKKEFPTKTFARSVPEREDDFAWENDKIAFRMYSQKLAAKENVDSGIDVWVKKVPYLIIDKWYKSGHYHDDHGEGLDFYKVGPSRGCGGLGILFDEKIHGTGGYSSNKVIANGPIRSIFELAYETFEIDGKHYSEVRRISIDAGSNFNKIESNIKCLDEIELAVGLKIHEEKGEVDYKKKKGFVSFWEYAGDKNDYLGTAILMKYTEMLEAKELDGHHVAIAKVNPGESFVYYTGAGWSKSGDFDTKGVWDNYVSKMALRINNPVKINIERN